MKIPKHIKIAAYDFRVQYPYDRKDFKWAAEIDHDKHKIRIASRGSEGKKKAGSEIELNLLHEILHGVNCRYLPPKQRLREPQIQQISEGLYQVLKDNKLRF